MTRQQAKAAAFAALHSGKAFVMPNPWDAGSARVLAALGFPALATTSSAFAFTLGRLDGGATLDEVVAHVAALDRVTALPLSVDLENGYGADPQSVALAIRRVAEAGAVGASIEDYDPAGHIYELHHATDRIAAAVGAARQLDFPFMLTARAENLIRGNPDFADTIKRIQAFEQAGARMSSTRPGCARSTRYAWRVRPSPSQSMCLPSLGCRSRRSPRPVYNG
jgi:2-methylisocitrate lyase-like PEP mutase family enzyme